MKVLMVCLGNICRSPLAEGILRSKLLKSGIAIDVDSAGVSDYHTGEQPDKRAIEVADEFGVDISSQRARKVQDQDFTEFDLILAMDKAVLEDLQFITQSIDVTSDIELFLNYSGLQDPVDVPDPYYGGHQGFVDVYKLIENACERIMDRWQMMDVGS